MAGINWTSNSINNFFRTSLNQSNSGMNNLYSLLGDRTLIKSGSYHKLMDAYVKKVKTESDEDSKAKSESIKKSKDDEPKTKATKENTTTYTNNGVKSKKSELTTDSIIDTLI